MTNANHPIVFMYHGIIANPAQIPAEREIGAELYDVSLENFSKQIEFLKDNHFQVSSLETDNAASQASRIVLTFDDGERNNFENAFPILQRLNFPAYFFMTVDHIGRKGYLDWECLKELRDTDMIIGSHGFSHTILTEIPKKKLEHELLASKEILEKNLKINVESLSIPRGFYNEKILEMAREFGYKNIFVSDVKPGAGHGCTNRVAVRNSWNLERFKQALVGQVPITEAATTSLKNISKRALGGGNYDFFRRWLLKIAGRK